MTKISTLEHSQKAMTLTELILAAALVGIVALGAVSIDYAIRNMRNSVYKDSMLTTSTTNVMEQIHKDANLAIGNNADRGILTANGLLCMRINIGNFTITTDDAWTCYGQVATRILRCQNTGTTPAVACADTSLNQIGTAVTGGFTYNFIINSVTRDLYLDVSITNRFPDPVADAHPINNPEYTLDTRVYPASHSF